MSNARMSILAGLLALVSAVQGHMRLEGIDADQKYTFKSQAARDPKVDSVGWHTNNAADAVIWLNQVTYDTPDIVCGKGYEAGNMHAKVAAGDEVKVRWASSSPNHRGPIIDYLAPCNGPCDQIDKTKLKFVKIAETGLITPGVAATALSGPLGIWATDLLFRTAVSTSPQPGSPPDKLGGRSPHRVVRIPANWKPGFYTLREEPIALFAGRNTTQNYPRCINLEITGNGTESPEGVVATELYDVNEPGITARVWQNLKNYTIPGPPLYSGAGNSSTSPTSSSSSSSASASVSSPSVTATIPVSSGFQSSSSVRPSVTDTQEPVESESCAEATTVTVESVVTVTVTPTNSHGQGYAQPTLSALPISFGMSSDGGYAPPSGTLSALPVLSSVASAPSSAEPSSVSAPAPRVYGSGGYYY